MERRIEHNWKVIYQCFNLNRLRSNALHELFVKKGFWAGCFCGEAGGAANEAIDWTFEQAGVLIDAINVQTVDAFESIKRIHEWVELIQRAELALMLWDVNEQQRKWQRLGVLLTQKINDKINDWEGYSRWFVLTNNEKCYFDLIHGRVVLDLASDSILGQNIDFITSEFSNGFLILRSRESELDLQAYMEYGHPPPEVALPRIGAGTHFVQTSIGRIYFLIQKEQIAFVPAAQAAISTLGPTRQFELKEDGGRHWLRLLRYEPHPNREYVVQKSTM